MIGDRICEGDCLHGLSGALRGQGRFTEALEAIDHALTLARADEYPVAEALWLVESARVQCGLATRTTHSRHSSGRRRCNAASATASGRLSPST